MAWKAAIEQPQSTAEQGVCSVKAAHVADYVREQGHFAAPSMGGLQLHVHGAAAGCGRIWVDFDLGMKLLGNNWLGS